MLDHTLTFLFKAPIAYQRLHCGHLMLHCSQAQELHVRVLPICIRFSAVYSKVTLWLSLRQKLFAAVNCL